MTCESCGEDLCWEEEVQVCGEIWLPGDLHRHFTLFYHDACLPAGLYRIAQEALGNA